MAHSPKTSRSVTEHQKETQQAVTNIRRLVYQALIYGSHPILGALLSEDHFLEMFERRDIHSLLKKGASRKVSLLLRERAVFQLECFAPSAQMSDPKGSPQLSLLEPATPSAKPAIQLPSSAAAPGLSLCVGMNKILHSGRPLGRFISMVLCMERL
jgi:hypothetical protein